MILAPATLGMLGGGQLGRFFVMAAHELGYKVWVLDPDPTSPAGQIADRHLAAAYEDQAALQELATHCAAITTEFENVPASTLEFLAQSTNVHPSAQAVAVCQNRIAEKTFLRNQGLPHGPFLAINSAKDLVQVPPELFPGIMKVARFGYDGKGQVRVANAMEALHAFNQFEDEPCVLEKQLTLDSELSIVLARNQTGNIADFCSAENIHRNGILDISIAPARQKVELLKQAQQIASEIAHKLHYVGVMGVEFFVSNGQLYVNEMAPRPHNSGHFTLDACLTNQFEQQVRALCGLPLGETRSHSHAVMINILGDAWYKAGAQKTPDWFGILCEPNLKLHLYGKTEPRVGRKMGHFTVIGANAEEVMTTAMRARAVVV